MSDDAARTQTPNSKPEKTAAARALEARKTTRRRRRFALRLVVFCLVFGAAVGGATFDWLERRPQHGEANLLFPPWMGEKEVFARIDRAGGVAIADPGRPAGRGGLFRAIAARADFAARARDQGAWLVLFSGS